MFQPSNIKCNLYFVDCKHSREGRDQKEEIEEECEAVVEMEMMGGQAGRMEDTANHHLKMSSEL